MANGLRRSAVLAAKPRSDHSHASAAAKRVAPILHLANVGPTDVVAITFGEMFHVRQRQLLHDQLRGPWLPRRSKQPGMKRYVQVDDPSALAIMRCKFDRAVTGSVLWAIFWRQQSTHPKDSNESVPISIDELVAQTGYVRSTVCLGLAELRDRGILWTDLRGGGAHRKSEYSLTPPDMWLL